MQEKRGQVQNSQDAHGSSGEFQQVNFMLQLSGQSIEDHHEDQEFADYDYDGHPRITPEGDHYQVQRRLEDQTDYYDAGYFLLLIYHNKERETDGFHESENHGGHREPDNHPGIDVIEPLQYQDRSCKYRCKNHEGCYDYHAIE